MNGNQTYEVYTHSNINTGIPFYVGSGKVGRSQELAKRNNDWYAEVDSIGTYDINIVATYDNIQDARIHEDKLLHFYGLRKNGGLLTNQRFMTDGGPIGYKFNAEQLQRHSQKQSEAQKRDEVRLKKGRGGVVVKDLITGEFTIYLCTYDCRDRLNELGIKCCHMSVHNWCVFNDNSYPDSIVSPKRYPQLAFFYHDRWTEVFCND